MDQLEKRFDLLMSEKDVADSFIKGYADLNVRLLLMMGVVVTMLGWVLSDKGTAAWSEQATPIPGIVALCAVTLTGGVVLQMLISYGTALGYMYYKRYIAAELRKCLEIAEQVEQIAVGGELTERIGELKDPVAGSRVWFESPSTAATKFAAVTLIVSYFTITLILLVFVLFRYSDLALWTSLVLIFETFVFFSVYVTARHVTGVFDDEICLRSADRRDQQYERSGP
jgi:hypothetical protein